MNHEGSITLRNDFAKVWKRLKRDGQPLGTARGQAFVAFAQVTARGERRGDRFIMIKRNGKDFARIYQCCWGHMTNCDGIGIGGHSDALDNWAKA